MTETNDLTWPEVQRALVPLMRADNRTNIAYIARDYAALALALGGSGWAYWAWAGGRLGTAAFAGLAVLGVLAIAAVQHRLSGLGHEAGHYVLFRDKLANELASDLLLMFPLMAMTQRFRASHNGHHRFVNDPERDPDFSRLHDHPDAFPMPKPAFWMRYVVRSLWPPTLLGYLWGQARNANATAGQPEMRNVYRFRVGRCMRGAYWISVLSAVHLAGQWPVFWLFWVVPLLTAYPFFMQLREIAHHSNAPDAGDFTNSRVFRVHPLLNACIFPYGQDFHVTHHLFGMLPHYRMAEADAVLRRYPPYRAQVVVCRGYFFRTPGTAGPSVLDVLSDRRAAAHA